MRNPLSSFALAIFASARLLSIGHAEVSPVRLRVEQVSKNDTTAYKSVQTRVLNIHISNTSGEALELKVKFQVFGRALKDQQIVSVAEGELPAAVKPRATEKISTPEAHAVAEEERLGSKGKSEARGNKIVGQGVQVLLGDVVVAESFEPASLKESFGKAPPAQKIEKKKK